MAKDALTVTDERSGARYELAIERGAIRATDLKRIKPRDDEDGLLSYDPALANTAICKSAIGFVDGDRGILRYRGYPIEELAEKSSYLETAYLIVKGELPDEHHFAMWRHNITTHSMVHENIKKFMDGFRYDAHPMGMLVGTVGALSTFYPDAKHVLDLESRRLQTRRLIGKMPTLAAFAYRRSRGLPYVYPDNDLSYTGNFLSMLFNMTELRYKPDPVLERTVDVLFILHAEHEQNCSTNAVRCVASARTDPYSAVAAGIAALYGPLHGGANEEVIRMLEEIGTVDRIPEYLKGCKTGERRLMGFGHRLYRNYDPRARLIKKLAYEVFEVTGKNPLIDIAIELERQALDDEYFVARKLFPNLDYYSGLIYQALGLPMTMFPVLFAIARTAGWMAHWAELIRDPEQKIIRPRQIYVGEGPRAYTPIEGRPEPIMREDAVSRFI
ncbi:MAG: citrate synthase [Deltaproteobacteria bacterium]|nr:MAG: citrate synthase [Deltaproteobacteria bacterium]